MKGLKKLLAFAVVPAMLFSFAACGETGGTGGGGGTEDGGYKDVVERPEIEMPETPAQVQYPEKPASAPAKPAEGVKPSVKEYVSSQSKSGYTVEKKGNGAAVTYREVSNWAYVYASVENYSPAYGNFKITLQNGDPAAERIAIQAVYYEAYDLGYAPVTVHMGEIAEGEQYIVVELGEYPITNASYQPVQGESVKDKTIIGFVIFVDSLPSYAATDRTGAFEITNFEFLADGDPSLEDRYVKPVADLAAATAEGGATVQAGETVKVSGSGSAIIPLEKYSVDYTKFNVTLRGEAETEVELALRYTLGGKTMTSAPKQVTLNGGDTAAEYDFFDLRPTEGGDDITTQFVKNGEVQAIVVTPKTDGREVEICAVSFVRTATDGAYVSDAWTSTSDVTVLRAANGGNAKLEYMFYTAWNNFTVPVRKGAGVTGITFKIYAPEGLTHLGIGIKNNAMVGSAGQSAGTFILRGSSYLFNGAASDTVGTIGDTEPNLKGLVETVAYDEATKIYTISYDFTGVESMDFSEYTLTSLIFYLNCPGTADEVEEHLFEGSRALYFLSIDLTTD